MARPSAKARKALGKVLRWLEAGAPHVSPKGGRHIDGFNMAYGVSSTFQCGTVCCIAGAVCQFNNLGYLRDGDLNFFTGAGPLATEFLGISEADASQLFMPFDYHEVSSSDLTPAVAAATLLHYIKTGDVVWRDESGKLLPRTE